MNLSLTPFFYNEFENGQIKFCNSIKTLLYKTNKRIFEVLDFENDDIYLEPMLFAFFNNKHSLIPLDQIIFGYIDQAKKPGSIKVYSDNEGIVYLPNVGYFYSEYKNTYFDLKQDHASNSIELFMGDDSISYNFLAIQTLLDVPNIEVCIHSNPLFLEYISQWNGFKDYESLKVKETAVSQKSIIEAAFEILKRSSLEEYKLLVSSTKKIMLFRNPEIRCFVTRSVHGVIFLNIPEICNETFYLEELIHQCSHNVFNAVTADVKEYFKVDPSSPLINYSKQVGENRSLYDALHGHYTVCKGIEYLSKCMQYGELTGDKMHELIGRIAIKERRFRIGLNLVNFDEVFKEKGKRAYEILDTCCVNVIAENPSIFGKYDFSNQSTVFNYQKFKEAN